MTTRWLNKAGLVAIALTVAVAAVGCGSEQGDGASVTSVRHNADGTTSVDTVWMTSEQLSKLDSDREHLASLGKAGGAASLDTGCAGASMWVYDNYWQTGNRICFAGPGVDYLANYSAPGGGTWATANKSCWAGAYDTYFQYTTGSYYAVAAWGQSNGPGSGYNRMSQGGL